MSELLIILVEYAAIVVATWRISRMLVIEGGPFGIFETMRYTFSTRQENWLMYFLHTLFSCQDCMSVWVAATLVLATGVVISVPAFVVAVGAASGASMIIRELFIWLQIKTIG